MDRLGGERATIATVGSTGPAGQHRNHPRCRVSRSNHLHEEQIRVGNTLHREVGPAPLARSRPMREGQRSSWTSSLRRCYAPRLRPKQALAKADKARRGSHHLQAAPDRRSAPQPWDCPAKGNAARTSDSPPRARVRGRGSPEQEHQRAGQTLDAAHPGNIRSGAVLPEHELRERRIRVGVNPSDDGLQH